MPRLPFNSSDTAGLITVCSPQKSLSFNYIVMMLNKLVPPANMHSSLAANQMFDASKRLLPLPP